MNKNSIKKYALFVGILLVGLVLDQWTKMYASDRLATTRGGYVDHRIVLDVDSEDDGETVQEFLSEEFEANTSEEVHRIAESFTRLKDSRQLDADDTLEAGQQVEVLNRGVTVIEGYWDFEYTENPGAAFGLLSESNSDFRIPFFIAVSIFAVLLILYILRTVHWEQKLLIFALGFIGTGALGNFIDRIRFGHVIDFIVWKYTDAYRWPTFNIADAFITVGVVLMLIEIIRDGMREHSELEGETAETG